MSFPTGFLDELRTRLPLSDVLGRRLRLVRAGRLLKCACPFHNEKSPSMVLYDDHYHCFGCGAHGDIVTFTMQMDNLSFIDAVEKLAGEAGLEVPRASPQDRQAAGREATLREVMEQATQFFIHELKGAPLQYLRDRGLDDATVARFRLGYAPHDGQALLTHLQQKNIKADLLIELGLARKSERDGQLYSFFRDRVMFPVTDRNGRVVAFGGRVLQSTDNGPKYINSPDHPLFTKGKLLYNLPGARQAVRDDKPIVVVEGYTDVIACARAGLIGAVAPLGTALTELQLQLIWKLNPQHSGKPVIPIICFDGDTAGRTAAYRALDRMLPYLAPYQTARFVFLPDGEDPDTLLRKQGVTTFTEILQQAMGAADLIWQRTLDGGNAQSPEGRAALRKQLLADCARIQDRDVRAQYEAELIRRFDDLYPTMPANVKDKIGTWRKGAPVNMLKPKAAASAGAASRATREHQLLLLTMLTHPALLDDHHDLLISLEIADTDLQVVHEALLCAAARETEQLWTELAAHDAILKPLWQDQTLRQLHRFAFDAARHEDARAFCEELVARQHQALLAAERAALLASDDPDKLDKLHALAQVLTDDNLETSAGHHV